MVKADIVKIENRLAVLLPEEIVNRLSLSEGAKLFFNVSGDIVSVSDGEEETLEELLINSNKDDFVLTDEDRQWLDG